MDRFARALALGLLLAPAGCGGDKERVRREARQSHDAWYRQAWGVSPDEKAIAAFDSRFDCVWGEIARAGDDPAKDLRCLARRLDAQTRCARSHEGQGADGGAECMAAFESACSVSAAFERATKTTCKGPPSR